MPRAIERAGGQRDRSVAAWPPAVPARCEQDVVNGDGGDDTLYGAMKTTLVTAAATTTSTEGKARITCLATMVTTASFDQAHLTGAIGAGAASK